MTYIKISMYIYIYVCVCLCIHIYTYMYYILYIYIQHAKCNSSIRIQVLFIVVECSWGHIHVYKLAGLKVKFLRPSLIEFAGFGGMARSLDRLELDTGPTVQKLTDELKGACPREMPCEDETGGPNHVNNLVSAAS